MAAFPICCKIPYKDYSLSTQNAIRPRDTCVTCDCSAFRAGSKSLLLIPVIASKRWQALSGTAAIWSKTNSRGRANATTKSNDLCNTWYASNSGNTEEQLRLLESYLRKLQGQANRPSSDSRKKTQEIVNKIEQINTREELESLNAYLSKLTGGSNKENFSGDFREENLVAKPFSGSKGLRLDGEGNLKSISEVRNNNVDSYSERNESLKQYDETSDLYFVGILASINIAVFLFEIASPVRNSQFELFSLPLVYGAKINDLILVGEWWRLVTPMFLHSGALHVALGCWSLLTFGPQVCRTYGSFTFFLIYMLGGISGNLTSYLHTPEPTVGGTGPVFAIIGAWLTYQIQNKGVIAKDVSEHMFQKAVVITALSCILSNFGPIDDWTHLGAAITGIVYGFFTCPTLQLDGAPPRTGRDEGIALVRRYTDPCKSLMVFTIFMLILGSLLFLVEPPFDTIMADEDFVKAGCNTLPSGFRFC